MLNREIFFSEVRGPVFGGRLSQAQVDGCEVLLDSLERNHISDDRWAANVLSQVYQETGGYMLPIKETVLASHKNMSPSDAEVIRRLNNAWSAGRLTWVRIPYWRDGWFGRGPIQLTHEDNYRTMGERLGVDLVANPDLALDPKIGADIAVIGMSEGLFTGQSLGDYFVPGGVDSRPAARRIVNGPDGTDEAVADRHELFLAALRKAGYSARTPVVDDRIPEAPKAPPGTPVAEPTTPKDALKTGGLVGLLIAALTLIIQALEAL